MEKLQFHGWLYAYILPCQHQITHNYNAGIAIESVFLPICCMKHKAE